MVSSSFCACVIRRPKGRQALYRNGLLLCCIDCCRTENLLGAFAVVRFFKILLFICLFALCAAGCSFDTAALADDDSSDSTYDYIYNDSGEVLVDGGEEIWDYSVKS